MADKKNLCAQIDTALHMRVRQEQEQSGKTLSEFVEQLITDYYKMKEGTKMTGDMRTMAIQLPEELFERLKAYLKKNNLKQKQFIIGLIEDALEQDEEDSDPCCNEESEEKARALAEYYRNIALRNHCFFMDAAQYAQPSGIDGMHLGEDGHAQLGKAIAQFILQEDRI